MNEHRQNIFLKALASLATTAVVVVGIAGTAMADDTSGAAPASPIAQARVAQAVPTQAFAEVLTPELQERLNELEHSGECQRINPQGPADPLAGQPSTAGPFMLVGVTGSDTPTLLKCDVGGRSGGATGGDPGRRNGPGQQNDPWKTYETFCGSRDGARPGLPHQGWASNDPNLALAQMYRDMAARSREMVKPLLHAAEVYETIAVHVDRVNGAMLDQAREDGRNVLEQASLLYGIVVTDGAELSFNLAAWTLRRMAEVRRNEANDLDRTADEYEAKARSQSSPRQQQPGQTPPPNGGSLPSPDDMGSADRAAFCQAMADAILARQHLEQTARYGPDYINNNCDDPVTNPAPVNDTASAPTLNPTGNRWQLDCTPQTDAPVSSDGSLPPGVAGEGVPGSDVGDGNGLGSKVPRKVPGLKYGFEPYCDPSVCNRTF